MRAAAAATAAFTVADLPGTAVAAARATSTAGVVDIARAARAARDARAATAAADAEGEGIAAVRAGTCGRIDAAGAAGADIPLIPPPLPPSAKAGAATPVRTSGVRQVVASRMAAKRQAKPVPTMTMCGRAMACSGTYLRPNRLKAMMRSIDSAPGPRLST